MAQLQRSHSVFHHMHVVVGDGVGLGMGIPVGSEVGSEVGIVEGAGLG